MCPLFDPTEPMRPSGTADYVCEEHFDDKYIANWINENAEKCVCDLCGSKAATPIAADTDEVVELIRGGLESEWEDETHEIPWGMGVETLTTYELITDLGISSDDEMINILIGSLPEYGWVQREFFLLKPAERLESGWEQFKDLAKHRSRYFFSLQEKDHEDPDDVAPLQLLHELGDAVIAADLITTWPVGTQVWRAHVHEPDEQVVHAWELAALPEHKADFAPANRMSPAGIAMFYGALEPNVAAVEAIGAEPEPEAKAVTEGQFQAARELRILDLAQEIEIPSMFDSDRRHFRGPLAFLRKFVEDLGQSIVRDRLEHVEYVPTQIVSEFFRSVYLFGDDTKLDGIAYRSTKTPDSTNVVLFVSNLEVADADGQRPPLPDQLKLLGPKFPRDEAVLTLVGIERTDNTTKC